MIQEVVLHIGRLNFRDKRKHFGIRKPDRRYHMYILGQTGSGKSTFLQRMIREDLIHDEGLAVLDPHGDLIEYILPAIPEYRRQDFIYFNIPDVHHPLGFNPLEGVTPQDIPRTASGMIQAMKNIWSEFWGARMEYILKNTLYLLLEYGQATMLDILRLFHDKHFRRELADTSRNIVVREFWLKEFEGYSSRQRSEYLAPIQNKVGAFLADPVLFNILTQPKSSFDIRKVMDGGILLVNLSKGKIGQDNAALMGGLILSRIQAAAMGRADIPENRRKDFYVYLDESHNFLTLTIAEMLSELRKYRVNLILSHQYLSQLSDEIREAIFGNVGNIISFRVGLNDAEILQKRFYPDISADDLISLPNYNIILQLVIDGKISKAFTAETLLPETVL